MYVLWSSCSFIQFAVCISMDVHWCLMRFINCHLFSNVCMDVHRFSTLFIDLCWLSIISNMCHWFSTIDVHRVSCVCIHLHKCPLIVNNLKQLRLLSMDFHPRCLQDEPTWPNMNPRWPKMNQKGPQGELRWPKSIPRGPQDEPRWAKMNPRWAKMS